MKPVSSTFQTRYKKYQNLAVITVSIVLLSLYFNGVLFIKITARTNISLWHVAAILVILIHFSRAQCLTVTRHFFNTFSLGILFFMYLCVQASRSFQPVRSVTMLLSMLLDLALFWIIGGAKNTKHDLHRLNCTVFTIGVIVSVLTLALYFLALTENPALPIIERLNISEIVGEVDRGRTIRIRGFSGDPNFFALYLSLPFFCGFTANIRILKKFLGIFLISLTFFFTYSRGLFVCLISSTLLLAFFSRHTKYTYLRHALLPIIAFSAFVLMIILPPFASFRPMAWQTSRFNLVSIHSIPRISSWSILLTKFHHIWHALIGFGLRSAENTLGIFSHNTYIDLLFDTGIFGSLLWMIFMFSVFRKIRITINENPDILPWIHSLILILFSFLFYSLLHNPILWTVSAVIMSNKRYR